MVRCNHQGVAETMVAPTARGNNRILSGVFPFHGL
jgi:hypothetical protein